MTVTPSDPGTASAQLSRPPSEPGGSAARPSGATGDGAEPSVTPGRWWRWGAIELHDDGPQPWPLVAVVATTVAAGVVLRFLTRSHLWLDEALSVDIARLPLGEIPEALRHDGHPPLYYVLLHLWMRVAGSGDVAVRALSGLISVATLPLAYVAGRRLGGRLLGLLALTVFSLSPFALRYATETRMYSLVTFLVLGGYLLVDDVARRGHPGVGRLAALALVAASLLWTHYWSLWLLGGLGAVLVWGWRRAGDADVRRGCARALVALAAGGLALVPWLPWLLYQSAHTATPWSGPVRPTTLLARTLTDFGGGVITGTFTEPQLFGAVMLVLVLLAVFGTARGRRRIELDLRAVPQLRAEAAVVAATVVLATAGMYVSDSAYETRYASTVLPLVLLLVAAGLSRLRDLRVHGVVLALVVALSSLGAAFNVRTDRTQVARLAEKVAERARPGDLVLYCPDQLAPAALRVMPPGLEHLAFPHLPDDAWPVDRVDWVDYVERNAIDVGAYARTVDEHASGRPVFVVSSDGYETHKTTCPQLTSALAALRGNPELLAVPDGVTYYERAGLQLFAPRPG